MGEAGMPERAVIDVEIVSDVVCPWCFVGKRRLERALKMARGRFDGRVTWRPFELNPRMPAEGVDRGQYLEAKFGSHEAARALLARLEAVGQAEGIAFAFDRIRRTPNTLDAHRLIWLAQREGPALGDAVVERLFHGYFLEGEDLTQRATLTRIAAASGLDADRVDAFLRSDEGLESVRQKEAEARRAGIAAVPHFIFNRAYAVSGAQPTETFLSAFEQVARDGAAGPPR